ncbi:MAG: helix-turn-helix transcriptional regulator [Clostridiales bacterium]|nr:helix-turn-helix transcriptional regulator [Clostridiales bacterium]
MKFHEKLCELRLEQGMTQKQVAEQLGVSTSCYGGYEQGYREPDFKTLIKICRYFHISSDELLGVNEP